MPVIAFDPFSVDFYNHVNTYWSFNGSQLHEKVVVLSTGGGYRDILVRDGLTILNEVSNAAFSVVFFWSKYASAEQLNFCNWLDCCNVLWGISVASSVHFQTRKSDFLINSLQHTSMTFWLNHSRFSVSVVMDVSVPGKTLSSSNGY